MSWSVLKAISVALCLMLGAATSAEADFGITAFDNAALTASGTTDTRAGGHPYAVRTTMDFTTMMTAGQNGPVVAPTENLKDVVIDFPVGFAGDPTNVPQCPDAQLDTNTCPPNTQVGTVEARQGQGGPDIGSITSPLYNLVPPPGEPAEFGFTPALFPVRIGVKVRTGGDYGITAIAHDLPQPTAITGSTITLWGVPADPRHDAERGLLCQDTPPFGRFCLPIAGGPGPVREQPKPFLTNPSYCEAPLATRVTVSSWQHPDRFGSAAALSQAGAGATGVDSCDRLTFEPTLTAKPADTEAGAPGGYTFDLRVPQNDNPTGLATPPLRKAVVTFPRGVTLSASSADGLAACSPAQVALSSAGDASCPDAAKVGTVDVETPVLATPLTGNVYLARQNDNPFNSLVALYIVAKGSGVVVKLSGRVDPDPVTGQLTATFDNNPQLPFSHLRMQFKNGARAALANPKTCGTYTTHAELTSWASRTPVVSESSFTIDHGCDTAAKFEATMEAGLTNPVASGSSSFVLNVGRPDGQQDISSMNVSLPPGLLADIGSVPLCAQEQAAAGTCPAISQVGVTSVESGPGPSPLSIPQPGRAPTGVFLAGPYKGAPYSLSIVVPAQAGPFDLGTVVVRATLSVDPVDAHATVQSDPLPTILQGIPLAVQRVHVVIDRPGFMVVPTSCAPMSIAAQVLSTEGGIASVQSRFQVGGCSSLEFKPKLAVILSGKDQTTDGKHPALAATLTMPSHQANIKKVVVQLPLALALDPDNAQSDDLCEFLAGRETIPTCPKSSIVGSAVASTPLLAEPLKGPVYFVKNVRTDPKSGRQIRTLPTLAIPLQGAGITLVVRASSQVVDGHLVTTFDQLPDAPVSNFKLNINGGKKDILVVSDADICKASQVAKQIAIGHNGKTSTGNITFATPCGLGVVDYQRSGAEVEFVIGGLGAGKVSVSGSGLTKASRTLSTATTATLASRLSAAHRMALARGRDVKVRVTVTFTPTGVKRARIAHRTITIRGTGKR
jgi:hypothetical protein